MPKLPCEVADCISAGVAELPNALKHPPGGNPFFPSKVAGLQSAVLTTLEERPRKNVAALSADERKMLTAAYAALHSMDSNSAPLRRRRGLFVQAAIHKLHCVGTVTAHNPTFLLAWHRAFIFLHERLLQRLLADQGFSNASEFRLPYWDPADFPAAPGFDMYATTDSLNIGPRVPQHEQDSICPALLGLQSAMTQTTHPAIANAMSNWHTLGHYYSGIVMKEPATAALDPLFYAWHANVDRIWYCSKGNNSVPLPRFCIFYDALLDDFANVELRLFSNSSSLGYKYQCPVPVPVCSGRPHELSIRNLMLPHSQGGKLRLTVADAKGREVLSTTLYTFGEHADEHTRSLQIPLTDEQFRALGRSPQFWFSDPSNLRRNRMYPHYTLR